MSSLGRYPLSDGLRVTMGPGDYGFPPVILRHDGNVEDQRPACAREHFQEWCRRAATIVEYRLRVAVCEG